MLGVFQIPLNECDDLYRKLGSDVFKQNVIVGTVKMSWSHAFYDSEVWENILKSVLLVLLKTGQRGVVPRYVRVVYHVDDSEVGGSLEVNVVI